MLIETATVISYQNGVAVVQCQSKGGCGSCSAKQACGSQTLSDLLGEKSMQFALPVTQALSAGDQIKIGLKENMLLKGVWFIYGIPLLILLCTTLLVSTWISHELLQLTIIVLVTGFSFRIIRAQLAKKPQIFYQPMFIEKV